MLRKVVVIGPESTGKSTLSQALSEALSCPWVPEFAREYINQLQRPYEEEDLLHIAQGQLALEERLAEQASDILICDTDLHVIKVWSEHRFGRVHPWVEAQLKNRKYDLYLLTDIDIPWQHDPQREHPQPEMRKYFFDWYKKLLESAQVPYLLVSGSEEERLKKALERVHQLHRLGKNDQE